MFNLMSMSARAVVAAAWASAAGSKDFPALEGRQQALSTLLSLLSAAFAEPWFDAFVEEQIKAIYPKQHRCLLDASLQRFIALSPLHCGCILQGFLSLSNSQTLNSPFRRDLAVLFKGLNQLSPSCWPQQGAVACSIISYLAQDAARHLWYSQQQQRESSLNGELHHTQPSVERLGTSISWLTDCLLQADWHQRQQLFQLLFATLVSKLNRLEACSKSQAEYGHADVQSGPPAKKQRLEPGLQQSAALQPQPATSKPSVASLHWGISILTAICCCEQLQSGSQSLVPAAAVAAATVAGSSTSQAVQAAALEASSWLFQHLAAQVTCSPFVATATSASVGSTSALQQGTIAAGSPLCQPADALWSILQHLADTSPSLVLSFVRLLMGLPAAGSAAMASATTPALIATGGTSLRPHSSSANASPRLIEQQPLIKQQWLLQAAKQWQLPSTAAVAGAKGKKPKRIKQQSAVAAGAADRSRLSLQQVLSNTSTVNATWLCKHVVPMMTQQAADVWQQQEPLQESGQQVWPPAAAALAQVLAEGHLLLPAAGEVLVSARFLAAALTALPLALQVAVARILREQLLDIEPDSTEQAVHHLLQQDGSIEPTGSMESRETSWKRLQPMLCLLSHLRLDSPFASALAAVVKSLLSATAAQQQQRSVVSTASIHSSICREVLQHLLLPIRFPISIEGRVCLLSQLLVLSEQDEQSDGTASADQLVSSGSNKPAAEQVVTVLQQVLQQEQQRLVRGMQLLHAHEGVQSALKGTAGSTGLPAKDRDLAVVVMQLLKEAKQAASRRLASCTQSSADQNGAWPTSVHQILRDIVEAASAATGAV